MSTEYCPQCGVPRVGAFRYCQSCQLDFDTLGITTPADARTALREVGPEREAASATESFTAKYGPSEPAGGPVATVYRSRTPWMTIGLILLAVAIVGGGAYLYLRNQVNEVLSEVGQSVTLPTHAAATSLVTEAPVVGVSASCHAELGSLATALMDLDSRLSVGMSFNAYSEKVADARVVYDRIHVSALDSACLEEVGAPAEAAFNNYIYAYRIWNACIDKLDCTTDSIEPKLQAYWAKATAQIDRFRDEMK